MRFHSPIAAAALALLLAVSQAQAADTPIYTIQGSGTTSPLLGQVVTTTGVVTKLTNNGFFLQDPVGDNDPLTSDGIFVFTSTAPTVTAGQLIRLTGTVAEFNVGSATNADTLAHKVTELTGPSAIAVLGTGSITPVVVTLPELVNDELERYEGMLVTITGPLMVQQNAFQGRFGQLTMAVGGRLETPTNRYRPNSAQALALADENARRRIILDDGRTSSNPNPTPYMQGDGVPRAGDVTDSITGVIDYGLAGTSNAGAGDYKIHPVVTPLFTVANPRTTTPPAVGGTLRLGAMNVLNFFTTFTNGQTADGQSGQGCTLGSGTSAGNCRGADSLTEFLRQRTKIVEALAALNADAVGLMEIQNNGATAPQNLVDALNAKVGAGTYAVVPDPAFTGTDAIKVAMIYKPARLTRVGGAVSDTDPVHNRPPTAQTFAAANGERVTLVVNHLKSKGSCPSAGSADAPGNVDSGDGQGCWNASRVQQAQRTRTWVSQVLAAAGSSDALLVGDFNAYGREDPIDDFTSNGFVDQIGRFNTLGYSYVFDGMAGRLDHAISNGSMSSKIAFATHWHINADEAVVYDYNLEFKAPLTTCGGLCPVDPYQPNLSRASDHDPVLVGVNLFKTISGTSGRDVLVGTAGDDILVGGPGADTMTGGAGTNVFVYLSLRDAGDRINDFVPGKDKLDLRTLLAGIGFAGTDPVAEGWVSFTANDSGTSVNVRGGSPASGSPFRPLTTLALVDPASLSSARDLIAR